MGTMQDIPYRLLGGAKPTLSTTPDGFIEAAPQSEDAHRSCLGFDGVSDSARLAVDQDLGIGNEWSVMLWVLPTDLTPSVANTLFEIHNLGSPGDDANSFRIDIEPPGILVFRAFTNSGSTFKNFTIDLTETVLPGIDGWFFGGTWSQIVVTWDGADFNMYRNGYLMNSDMTAVTDLAGVQTSTSRSISIGSRVDLSNFFTGFMHSASYWSEALTQGAIRQIWNQGSGSTFNLNIGVEDYGPSVSGIPSTGYDVRTLEAWWQLGKDITSPVKDWTNNANNLAVYEVVEETMPTGMIVPFGGDVAPSGYLMCDGSEKDRGTYAALYAVIGDNYGNGNGVDTFNLPGSAGRMPQGKDAGIPDFDTLGNTGGEKDHTLSVAELASHTHDIDGVAISQGTVSGTNNMMRNLGGATDPAGSGLPHNNMSPYFVTNYIIQT
jgi:microcystin-dependent protein